MGQMWTNKSSEIERTLQVNPFLFHPPGIDFSKARWFYTLSGRYLMWPSNWLCFLWSYGCWVVTNELPSLLPCLDFETFLRCNSHFLQVTHSKCTIWWCLGYIQTCGTITVNSEDFINPQKTSWPWEVPLDSTCAHFPFTAAPGDS